MNAPELSFDAHATVDARASSASGSARTTDVAWPVFETDDEIFVIRTADEILALEADWTRLADQHARPSHVFQQFGWARQWLASFGGHHTAADLAVGIARRDGELILVLPLFVQRIAGARCLKWLGDPVGQYGDLIVADVPDRLRLISAVFDAVLGEARADAIFLQRVRDDANIRPFLERLGALGTEPNEAPYIDLSGFASFEDYDGAMFTRRKQRERKRLRRRLDEMGPVT
ncbi:MAG: hypothetical protein AAFZ05_13445, partial [Pseudomonadota bacterium]